MAATDPYANVFVNYQNMSVAAFLRRPTVRPYLPMLAQFWAAAWDQTRHDPDARRALWPVYVAISDALEQCHD